MSHGLDILRLMGELRRMPEYDLFVQLQAFTMSIYTFDRNFQDLSKFINVLATSPNAQELFTLRNNDQLVLAMREVIRLTHNYVAAAMSLIDHTRTINKHLYHDTDTFRDYQSRMRSEFAHDPLSQFVKCLRKYCQHYKAPDLAATSSWERGDDTITRTFHLLKADLTSFDGWSATAKRYLHAAPERINLLEVATAYREKVILFYQWFQSRQQEIHASELHRFRQKETQLLTLMLKNKIAISFSESQQGRPHRKDDIFLSIFTSREFKELEPIPRDSPERPLRAIQLLEERFFHIPDAIKQDILRLYQLPDIPPD